MPRTLDPFRLLLFAVAAWMNHQQQIIDYLPEENRICTHNSVHGDCASMTNSGVASR